MPDDRRRRRHQGRMMGRRLLMVIASIALVSAAYFGLVRLTWVSTPWRVAAWTVAAVSLIALLLLRHNPKFRDIQLGGPKPRSNSLRDIQAAARYVQEKYGGWAILHFQNVLTSLPTYLVRVDQKVEVEARELWTSTQLTFRYEDVQGDLKREHVAQSSPLMESESSKNLLLPIVTARKGLMFDRFSAYSQAGQPLALLSQYEVRGLLAAIVETIFTQPLAALDSADPAQRDYHNDIRAGTRELMDQVLRDAVCFVGNTPAKKPSGYQLRDKRVRALKKIQETLGQWPGIFDAATRDRLTDFCTTLTYNYVIAAEIPIPSGNNFTVRYEHQVASDLMRSGFEERIRARLGLDPVTIDVPVSRALQADSFHLQIKAPENQYVFDHHLERLGSTEPVQQEDFATVYPERPYVKLHHLQGRSVGHLYVRRQGSHPYSALNSGQVGQPWPSISESDGSLRSFKSVIRFREVPPGSLSAVALLSALTTIFVVFFTLTRAGLDGASGFQGGPAVILALPGFLAAGLGRGVDGKGLARSSLSLTVALTFVCANSIASVLLYVLSSVGKLGGEVWIDLSEPLGSVVLHSYMGWIILSAWSLATTLCVYREKRAQTSYYIRISRNSAIDNEKRSVQNERDMSNGI